jgi:dolichyl-diphosphooligosaccharide--protein glycosyltransferase
MKNKKITNVLLLEKLTFKTMFNQMYILGRYDKMLFEEVFNDFPLARAFRLKKTL